MFPALGANKDTVYFAHGNQSLAVEAIRAICPLCGIDYVPVAGGMDAKIHAGGDKGAARFFLTPLAARFKAALFGILAALALCLPVGAAETTSLHEIGEKRLAEKNTSRNSGDEAEKKTDDRRRQVSGEKRSEIHDGYSYLFCFAAGFIVGVVLIYAIIWLIASIWR